MTIIKWKKKLLKPAYTFCFLRNVDTSIQISWNNIAHEGYRYYLFYKNICFIRGDKFKLTQIMIKSRQGPREGCAERIWLSRLLWLTSKPSCTNLCVHQNSIWKKHFLLKLHGTLISESNLVSKVPLSHSGTRICSCGPPNSCESGANPWALVNCCFLSACLSVRPRQQHLFCFLHVLLLPLVCGQNSICSWEYNSQILWT